MGSLHSPAILTCALVHACDRCCLLVHDPAEVGSIALHIGALMNSRALSCMRCLSVDLRHNAVSDPTTISELLALDMLEASMQLTSHVTFSSFCGGCPGFGRCVLSPGLLRRPAFGMSMAPVCGPSRTQRSTWASARCTLTSPPLQRQSMLRSVPPSCCACTTPLLLRMGLVGAKPGALPSSPSLCVCC